MDLLYSKFYKNNFFIIKKSISLYILLIDNCYYLKKNNNFIYKSNSIYEICNYLDFFIQQIFINSNSDFAIHCACIKYKKNICMFIGPGGCGKSTIVAHFLEKYNNCKFLSDETVLIEHNKIQSFPRSILIKNSKNKLTEKNLLFDFDKRAYLIPNNIKYFGKINTKNIKLFFLDYNNTVFSVETITQIIAMDLLRKNLFSYNKNKPKNVLKSLINLTEGENYLIHYKTWEQVLEFYNNLNKYYYQK